MRSCVQSLPGVRKQKKNISPEVIHLVIGRALYCPSPHLLNPVPLQDADTRRVQRLNASIRTQVSWTLSIRHCEARKWEEIVLAFRICVWGTTMKWGATNSTTCWSAVVCSACYPSGVGEVSQALALQPCLPTVVNRFTEQCESDCLLLSILFVHLCVLLCVLQNFFALLTGSVSDHWRILVCMLCFLEASTLLDAPGCASFRLKRGR